MQFISVPNTCSVELIFDVFGQKCENVYHVTQGGSWTEEDLTTLAPTFVDWWNAYGKALAHDGVSLTKIVLKDMGSQTGPAIEYSVGLPSAGAYATGDNMPLNVTAAISFGTALRGRSYRGRVYQIGLTSSMVVNNQLNSTYRAALIAGYAALVAAVAIASQSMVVVSKFSNKAPRAIGVHTSITSVNVDVNLDSQRRRLTGRGQ